MSTPLPIAFLNNHFLPLPEASISPMDRGFLFGDGVYEVIPVYQGRLFRIAQHLQRLQHSLDAIELANPYTDARWVELLSELINRNGGGDQSLYFQITRGTDIGRDHRFPHNVAPTVFAIAQQLPVIADSVLREGVKAITAEDIRWQRCDIKSISLLGNLLHRQQAEQAGAGETILIKHGHATEGSSTTLFVVDKKGTIRTPPKDNRLLPGVTRDLILELLRAAKLPVEEVNIDARELANYSEIWLASSLREVVAVTRLDDKPVGNGTPGPVWKQAHQLVQQYKRHVASA